MMKDGTEMTAQNRKAEFLVRAQEHFGKDSEFANREMLAFAEDVLSKEGFVKADWNWVFNPENKIGSGRYRLPSEAPVSKRKTREKAAPAEDTAPEMALPRAQSPVRDLKVVSFNPNADSTFSHAEVPVKDPHFVPFGEFKDVSEIVKSGQFFPLFISGMSGNGKTFMVEQACARNKRPMVRVQMSPETDEDDLIGGFRLVNGETKFMKGPVLRAMEEGALLLIDEADRANPGKIMCLQGVLEGKQYYVKKTGEIVTPAPGFNVIVTANTKGKGSDDGRYVAATVLDDAWLERFPITIEQQYPSKAIERRILTSVMTDGNAKDLKDEDKLFIESLTDWSEMIRKTFDENGIEDVISTRRLVHIIKTYRIFNDRMRAIDLCTNRFDIETKTSLRQLYTKIDATVNAAPQAQPADGMSVQSGADDIPF
jgi:hypothetical protein